MMGGVKVENSAFNVSEYVSFAVPALVPIPKIFGAGLPTTKFLVE